MEDHSDIVGQVDLALSNAKRVQREARVVVQTLGRLRDALDSTVEDTATATAQEGTSNHEHRNST